MIKKMEKTSTISPVKREVKILLLRLTLRKIRQQIREVMETSTPTMEMLMRAHQLLAADEKVGKLILSYRKEQAMATTELPNSLLLKLTETEMSLLEERLTDTKTETRPGPAMAMVMRLRMETLIKTQEVLQGLMEGKQDLTKADLTELAETERNLQAMTPDVLTEMVERFTTTPPKPPTTEN